MKLNADKTNIMVFNFTRDHQFTSRLYLGDELIETINETKLLGTIITSDLKWAKNSEMLVKKAYARMQMIQKLKSFGVNREDLVHIYILYIRSILELNCQVWHFSLTNDDESNIERVQKVALYLILHEEYQCYENALELLDLPTLKSRRDHLSLRFAKKCLKHPKSSQMFPLNTTTEHNLRNREKFYVQPSKMDRLLYSAIPQLQRALNLDQVEKSK